MTTHNPHLPSALSEALRWLLLRLKAIDPVRAWAREIAADAGVTEATLLDWHRPSGAQPMHALRHVSLWCHRIPALARLHKAQQRGDAVMAKAHTAILQKEIKRLQDQRAKQDAKANARPPATVARA